MNDRDWRGGLSAWTHSLIVRSVLLTLTAVAVVAPRTSFLNRTVEFEKDIYERTEYLREQE